jgi:ABC-type enterobactin transport system permease subunit
MPALGFPIVRILDRKNTDVPQNVINKQLGLIWLTYCIFAVSISVIAMLAVPMNISLVIVVLLGFAESISGFLLKNWPITLGGFILGIGGAVFASMVHNEAQLLIFTFGGIILVVTGLIIKFQYK